MRVLVSGGGVAGLTTAIALTQRGIEVDLVERSTSWRTNGAGITLYPNGERALRTLGLDEAVVGAGFRAETLRLIEPSGSVVGEFPFGRWPGVGGVIAIHRDALQRVLVDAASDASLALGSTVDAVDDRGDGVAVTFDDGTIAEYALLVVAEGIRSATRDRLFRPVSPRPVGQMYWRTSVREELVDVQTMIADEDRFVVLLPLGFGQIYFCVQTRCDPLSVDRGERIATMRAACEGLAGPVPAALDAVHSEDDVFVGPAEEIPEVQWRRGRVVLIGDAAHALSPAFAQGANLAIEDALVLSEELAATDDVDTALDAFVVRREPRVAFVQQQSAERIKLVNSGASQRDLQAAMDLVSEHLTAPA